MKKLFNRIMVFKYDLEKAYVILKELDKYNNIIAKLLKSYLFMISGNSARTETILIEIMNKELFEHALVSDIQLMKIENQIEMTLAIIDRFDDDFKNTKLIENFVAYIFFGSSGEFQTEFDSELTIKRGISYIREKYKSIQYGKPFPFVWGAPVYEMSSQVEYNQYIKSSVVGKKLINNQTSYLLFFRNLDGINSEFKKPLVDGINKLESTRELYLKTVYFRMLDNDSFYRFLTAHKENKIGLIANLKRKFFKEQILSNKNILFSIIQLTILGDLDPRYILKLMANERARL
ncbi:MAG: hypothetical protein ACJAS4_001380 [Bacteriovoracaceae bacterium]|jgi:hypothetical protein